MYDFQLRTFCLACTTINTFFFINFSQSTFSHTEELAKQYSPQDVENRIYQFWLDGHYFHAKLDPEKKPYTIAVSYTHLDVYKRQALWHHIGF